MDLTDLALPLIAVCISMLAVVGIVRFTDSRLRSARAMMREADEAVLFLFDSADLVDATPSARKMLKSRKEAGSDWNRFLTLFAPHFPDMRGALQQLDEGRKELVSPTDPAKTISAEVCDGLTRISYADSGAQQSKLVDRATYAALEADLDGLRFTAETAPILIWRQARDGQIIWFNEAYRNLADSFDTREIATWPLINLFPEAVCAGDTAKKRMPLSHGTAARPRMFDITSVACGEDTVHYAVDVTEIVEAEAAKTNHLQMFGRPFAILTVGLAIFDRDHRLMTFNPALADLTDLPIGFLSNRPPIYDFLHRMHEGGYMPTTANYREWREFIGKLERETRNGTYVENWELPNGKTYRVIGCPSPDRSIALMFEDISAHASAGRQYQYELEMQQVVLDSFDEATALFNPSGTLILCNSAYVDLWHGGDRPDAASTLLGETAEWRKMTIATEFWDEVRSLVYRDALSEPIKQTVRLTDGRSLLCRVNTLKSGETIVKFDTFIEAGLSAGLPPLRAALL
ncbi:PAS-domain containing protein [Marivivens aquimaris]|uniref:PAS-domain containing protein n=1 Tax=Marivivens aquimaris TaxID=2774876 RepID=UPI00187E0E95|nr:PAS-domain containing protein [Marivivens aquimaris]